MAILKRFVEIMESNINDLLDKAENPEKIAKLELQKRMELLAECKADTADVMAAEKAAKRALDEANANVSKYDDIARKALTVSANATDPAKAEEAANDAKKAIQEKQRFEATVPTLQANYDKAAQASRQMKDLTIKLTDDIGVLQTRLNNISSTVKVAKAQEAVNKAGKYSATDIDDKITRMEQKAQARLDKANATSELAMEQGTAKTLAEKYGTGSDASVEDELARLRAEMGLN